MIDPTKEIFRWGPIPGKFYYLSEFVSVCCRLFAEKYAGERWVETLLLFKNDRMVWINQMKSLRETGAEVFLKYMIESEKRKKIYQEWKKHTFNLLEFQQEVDKKQLEKLSDLELKRLLQTFFHLTINFWIDTIPAELGNYGSEEILKKELEKQIKNKDEFSSVMEILSAPEESSFYQEEEMDLAEKGDINEHQQKYFWLHNSYAGTKVLDAAYFAERKKKLKQNLREENKRKLRGLKEKKREIIEKYGLSTKIVEIATAISENISWQDERKKYIFINLHYKNVLLEEIARRKKYDAKDLLHAWYMELVEIIGGKDLHQELHSRRDGFGIHFIRDAKNLSQKETYRFWEEYVYEKIIEIIDHFEGVIASKGKQSKVQGKAKIILDPFKAPSFQKGDILIAPMTSPEYVFLMEKAAAIITDTGGLTCHAAIVSREFNVPCIVGTKVATQVLKDGDLIEVNTEKGTVTKLKKP